MADVVAQLRQLLGRKETGERAFSATAKASLQKDLLGSFGYSPSGGWPAQLQPLADSADLVAALQLIEVRAGCPLVQA